ncbi:MAG: DUF2075 domain-containing protein [Eubacteriales bacterium]|nr:DUF2075 domain-containing protein [Eubacteriales bacterium]
MFKVTVGDFVNQQYGDESYLENWPMLYILENGKQAYIGQSNHIKTRMAEHQKSKDKDIFVNVHFIYSSKFNLSVTLDYESKLIQYIAADGVFEVRNKNAGMADKAYFGKSEYDETFPVLWRRLQREKLVKHSLEEIENTDLFKYSPFKELNDDQRLAVDEILQKIQENPKQNIVVNGMPGSGKTIVAIYLLKYLRDSDEFRDKKIAIVIPQTSLRKTLKTIFKSIYGLCPADVIKPSDVTKQHYDILLVDEAHRLHQYRNISYRGPFKKACERIGLPMESDELDWIFHQCDCPVLFYDKQQVVGPSGIDMVRFERKLGAEKSKRLISYYTLWTQMRVKGGNNYMSYVEALFSGNVTRKKISNYDFYMVQNFAEFNQLMYQKECEYKLTRMVAGYAWEWVSKKDKLRYDIEIEGIKKQWNHCTEGWVHSNEAIDEVGCIHSVQGYDLNYTFVIIGNELGYDWSTGSFIVRRENYFDRNGKNTAGDDELLGYVKNIYYVLLTRGIRGTYLYVCDEELRKYFSNYIALLEDKNNA